jgi:hypothetical protein
VHASGGKRYVFLVSCIRCREGDDAPHLAQAKSLGRPGNLVREGRIQRSRDAVFSLSYDGALEPAPSSTSVQRLSEGPGRWRIATSGSRPALVVVAETWFPGWQATVDGRAAPVLKADGAFLGVVVGPGRHEVTFTFPRPAVSVLGRQITGLTLGFALILVVAGVVTSRGRRARSVRASAPRTRSERRSDRARREGPPPAW